jgi:hypothetical protein
MGSNLHNVLCLVWRRKWEVIVGIIAIILAVVATVPSLWYVLLIISGVFLVVLVIDLVSGISQAVSILRVKHLPVVVIVGKGYDEYRAMLDDAFATVAQLGFDETYYAQEFGVFRDDLIVRADGPLLPDSEAWATIASQFESTISRLAARLSGRRVYHLFLNCPVALAVGLGAMLRTHHEVVLYQYWPDSQPPYVPVIDFSLEKESGRGIASLQEPVTECRFTTVEEPDGLTSHALVSVHLFGRDPRAAVENQAGTQSAAVHIRNTYDSTLSADDEWLAVGRETVAHLWGLLDRDEVQRLELGLSSYLPLGFAIGMALGTQCPITVDSWYSADQEFKPVLELNKLRPTL